MTSKSQDISKSVQAEPAFSLKWFLAPILVFAVPAFGLVCCDFLNDINKANERHALVRELSQPGMNISGLLGAKIPAIMEYSAEEWNEGLARDGGYERTQDRTDRVYLYSSLGCFRYIFADQTGQILEAHEFPD